MNYGRCRTCYWYKEVLGRKYSVEETGKLLEQEGKGYCLMFSVPDEEFFYPISESSYCPDHWNRKKEKRPLEDWMKENNIVLPERYIE